MAGREVGEAEREEETAYLQLRDFTPVVVRRTGVRDRAEVIRFVRHLTADSIELRFGSPMREETVAEELLGLRTPDARVSLVMETVAPDPHVVGSAEFVLYRREPSRAEVAFLIEDDFQGRGAATLLLHELARRARADGVRWFTAFVLQENVAMSDVFVHSGYPYRVVRDGPQWIIELDIGATVRGKEPELPDRVGPPIAPS